MSDYVIVLLLWILLLVSERSFNLSIMIAFAAMIVGTLTMVTSFFPMLLYFSSYILLWRLYRWRVNTSHALFMVAYVSLYAGVWLVASESSPPIMWAVWYTGVSVIALGIASRLTKRYNGTIIKNG